MNIFYLKCCEVPIYICINSNNEYLFWVVFGECWLFDQVNLKSPLVCMFPIDCKFVMHDLFKVLTHSALVFFSLKTSNEFINSSEDLFLLEEHPHL